MRNRGLFAMQVAASIVAIMVLVTTASAATGVLHYSVNASDEAGLPVIPNLEGAPGTADATTVLSADVPTVGVPAGAGDRSIDGAGAGGVVSAGIDELDNTLIAEAGGFTYEAWFKWNGAGNVNSIIDYAGTEKLVVPVAEAPDGEARMRINSNSTLDTIIGPVAAGEWHYAAAVFDTLGNPPEPDPDFAGDFMISGMFTTYLDGAVIGTNEVTISGFGDSLNRAIGVAKHPVGFSGDNFDGLVYEPRVMLGALSKSELLWVPEPSSLCLLGLGGLLALAALRRRAR